MEIITTHKNVDFDAVACMVAARLFYPSAEMVLPRSVNANVRAFLSIHKDIFTFRNPLRLPLDDVDRLIVVDTNRWIRLDGMDPLMSRTDLDIHLWDHHPCIGDIQARGGCQENVGAAVTLFVRAMEERGFQLDPIHATLFLAGIYEDTGHLTFPATRSADARAAAFLLDCEADLGVIQTALRPAYGPRQKEVLTRLLEKASRVRVNGHWVSFAKLELQGYTPDLSSVVDTFRHIVNVDAVFGIFRDPRRDQCVVIGRSAAEGLDVGAVLQQLGGGGRPEAGSAMVKGAAPDGVEVWIQEVLRQNGQSSVQIYDLMSYPVFTVSSDDSVDTVHGLLKAKGHTGAPVMEGDRLVGIISVRDLEKLKSPSQRRSPVKAVMPRNVITITPGHGVSQALRLMVKHDIGRLPVVEDGRLVGIVTRSDLMLYYYNLA